MSNITYEERRPWWVMVSSLLDDNRNRAWLKKNEKSLLNELKQRGKIDPENIFTVHDPHTYVELKEDVPREKEFDTAASDFPETKEITTGYLKPHFRYSVNEIVADDYEKLINRLGLKDMDKVSLGKLPEIESFDKLLYSQYKRQISAIYNSNKLIAEELGILYREAEQAIVRGLTNSEPDGGYEKLPDEWTELILNLRSFFNKIQLEISPDKIERQKAFDQLIHNNYADSNLIYKTFEKINAIYRERQAYILTLRKLTRQLLPLESIKNDIIFNRELRSIKSIKREEALRDMPNPASFAQKIANRNKDPKGSDEDMITRTVTELREYLLDNDIDKLHGNVEDIIRHLIKNTEGLNADKKTIRKWINEYYSDYKKNRKKRLNIS